MLSRWRRSTAVPFGAHLRYLFYSGEQVLGAMQFSSPAWRMAVCERWIGWDEPARRCASRDLIAQSERRPRAHR